MKRIIQIVEQIEHSKSLILRGAESDLRMALLLLDNAVEIMMFRTIKSAMRHADMYERMLKVSPVEFRDEQSRRFYSSLKEKVISSGEKKRINSYFHEKVNFLSGEKIRELSAKEKIIPEEVAAVLNAIHLYRNEIYHRDYVRKETLKYSTLILYEIICDLFVALSTNSGGLSMSSGEADRIKEFRKRLGLKKNNFYFLNEREREYSQVSVFLKNGIEIGIKDLAVGLKEHLLERISNSVEQLEYLSRGGAEECSPDEALKRVQFFQDVVGKKPIKDFKKQLMEYKPLYRASFLSSLEKRAQTIEKKKDKLKLFAFFAQLEKEFEPLEELIGEATGALDAAIEEQVERMKESRASV
ncbi:MAG: hypothetical protein V1882_10480 [Candidatus Omnitrophota bacterium]